MLLGIVNSTSNYSLFLSFVNSTFYSGMAGQGINENGKKTLTVVITVYYKLFAVSLKKSRYETFCH